MLKAFHHSSASHRLKSKLWSLVCRPSMSWLLCYSLLVSLPHHVIRLGVQVLAGTWCLPLLTLSCFIASCPLSLAHHDPLPSAASMFLRCSIPASSLLGICTSHQHCLECPFPVTPMPCSFPKSHLRYLPTREDFSRPGTSLS